MLSSDVYVAPEVAAVKALHQHTIDNRPKFVFVKDFLAQLAQNLAVGYQRQEPAAITELNNYHPDYLGKPESEIRQQALDMADFQLVIAKEYGYQDWTQVEQQANSPLDHEFEIALDILLEGKKDELEAFRNINPSLLQARSSFGHRAQLIHYVGSNGVELWRQVVPLNLAEMTKMLLDKGADVQSVANVYGGSKVAQLVSTSGHPWEAGVAKEVLALF